MERKEYNRIVVASKTETHPTVTNPNENLIGSNEADAEHFYEYENSQKPKSEVSVWTTIKRFFKDQSIAIIAAVLTAAAIGLFVMYTHLHSDLAVVKTRVNYIEQSIEKIKTNLDDVPNKYVTITALQQSIEELQKSMDTTILLNTKDIEHQLDLIELTISNLQDTTE